MRLVTLHIYGTERARRTKILTSTATDASLGVYCRHHRRLIVVGSQRHHCDGSHWAMAGTVAALYPFGHWHTVFLDPHSMANLY